MADFAGKLYKYDRSENLEAFLDSIGVQGESRTGYINSKPDIKLVKNGDGSFTLNIAVGERTISNTFKSGVEFDEKLPALTCKSTVTVQSNKLVQVQKFPSGKVVTITMEFLPTELKTVSTVEGWAGSATRYFKAA
ncbi:Fatty acid-binding protein 1 [Eumeta japonica]|uniref:Fatty acid-binding protein 1 n=1 Tax=Eumeta variegata TaxID=151549 RepID=A0A4C1VAJ5_EUMVA|nr:Fatty acid-binding protein 1 [Eumeta japonica]